MDQPPSGSDVPPPQPPPRVGGELPPPGPVQFQLPCVRCGYELMGLPSSGACPECGAPVIQSLMGDLLRFSSPAYVAMLKLGALIVVLATIGEVLASIAGIGLAIAMPAQGQMLTQLLSVGASLALLAGWWLLATPDPAQEGRDQAVNSRIVLRVALIVQLVCTVGTFVLAMAPGSLGATLSPTTGSPGSQLAAVFSNPVVVLAMLAGVVNFAAMVTAYIASMFYVRALCRRLPNPELENFAKLMTWLGPLLSTVGIMVCIGPLVALVLRVVIVERVRQNLRRVQREMLEPIQIQVRNPLYPGV